MEHSGQDGEKVARMTYPTASFSLTVPLIRWIADRAERMGISKSEVVRQELETARRRDEEGRAA